MILSSTDQNHNHNRNHNHSKDVYENMFAATSQMDVIPLNDLIAGNVAYKNSHGKATAILRGLSGIASIASSSIFIWMILRSHKGLTTTQHRLLLGLCVFDIIYSLGQSTFNTTAPSELDYRVWNARGDEATCTAQGFFVVLGSGGGLFYNAALNLYYLAVVKYGKSEAFIRAKMEPFLHGVTIAVALIFSIALLVRDHYNSNGSGVCVNAVYHPDHCIGLSVGEVRVRVQVPNTNDTGSGSTDDTDHQHDDDDGFNVFFEIECGRGLEGAVITDISRLVLLIVPALIMIISLAMIYRTVSQEEQKKQNNIVATTKWGAAPTSTAMNAAAAAAGSPQQQEVIGLVETEELPSNDNNNNNNNNSPITPNHQDEEEPATQNNNNISSSSSNNNCDLHSLRRAVMRKAFAYTFAWLLSYGFYIIGSVFIFSGNEYPDVLAYLSSIFLPLQGMFNLFIYMLPRIISARNNNNNHGSSCKNNQHDPNTTTKVRWCRALSEAFWSRGKVAGRKKRDREQEQEQEGQQEGQQERGSLMNASLHATTNNNINSRSRTRKKKHTPQNKGRSSHNEEEEEKCEIQVQGVQDEMVSYSDFTLNATPTTTVVRDEGAVVAAAAAAEDDDGGASDAVNHKKEEMTVGGGPLSAFPVSLKRTNEEIVAGKDE